MSVQNIIERFWYSQSKFIWFFWPLHLIFLSVVLIKRMLYQTHLLSANQFSKPVIVVGNISVGGTGKTPFINQLIKLLKNNHIKAGIISRGYQSKVNHYPHQVTINDSAVDVGDEAFMQFSDLMIPIVIDPNRSRAAHYLINNNEIDLIISDDGLQHYKMSRKIEILLFDGKRMFGNQLILPFGPLREPINRLNSVDYVVQNGTQNNLFTKYCVNLIATKLINLKTKNSHSVNEFANKKVHAVAGIGNPLRFFDTLTEICHIKSKTIFADHYQFLAKDFEKFGNDIVVMTEKDASKCFPFAQSNWYYLKVEMIFNDILTEQLMTKVIKVIN